MWPKRLKGAVSPPHKQQGGGVRRTGLHPDEAADSLHTQAAAGSTSGTLIVVEESQSRHDDPPQGQEAAGSRAATRIWVEESQAAASMPELHGDAPGNDGYQPAPAKPRCRSFQHLSLKQQPARGG